MRYRKLALTTFVQLPYERSELRFAEPINLLPITSINLNKGAAAVAKKGLRGQGLTYTNSARLFLSFFSARELVPFSRGAGREKEKRGEKKILYTILNSRPAVAKIR
ncbi:MAG: hypothetical protein ACI81P_000322 [Neolewinella sp.]|jgi:hypothetical protein